MINENTGSGNEKVGLKKSKKEQKYLKKVKHMFHFLQHPRIYFHTLLLSNDSMVVVGM